MAITIQDLLASDTISQAVDKINFNFDQLLLNGGGPQGPNGPQGPPGPIGGRGERGSDWYDGSASPNTFIVSPNLISGDYYLQANGDVWEYNGTLWIVTPINLQGPTGTPGTSDGWLYIGNDGSGNVLPTNKNTLYPSGMPGGAGATSSNRGVSMVLVGGVTTNTPTVGFSYTGEYQLNDTMTGSLDSTIVSMLVHQKNSSARALMFMGGDNSTDGYEQSDITKLSSIYLGTDDSLNIDIPKDPATITSSTGAIGFNLFSGSRGQNFRAGRGIEFLSGGMGSGSGPFDIADITFELNEVNPALLPSFNVNVLGSNDAVFNLGKQIAAPATVPYLGYAYLGATEIRLDTRGKQIFNSDTLEYQFNGVLDDTSGSLLLINSTGILKKVAVDGGAFSDGIIGYDSSAAELTFSSGTDNYIAAFDSTNKLQNQNWLLGTNQIYPATTLQDLGIPYGLLATTISDIHLGGTGQNTTGSTIFFQTGTTFAPSTLSTSLNFRPNQSVVEGGARFRNNFNIGNAEDTTVLQLALTSSQQANVAGMDMQDVPNTFLAFGDYVWLDPSPQGSGDGRFYPKITFSPNNGTGGINTKYGMEPSGIYMEPGAYGFSNYDKNYILIKGSDGLTAGGGGATYGKSIQIIGGISDIPNSSRRGGVIIGAGADTNLTENSTTNNNFGGSVLVGWDANHDYGGASTGDKAAQGTARKIVLGCPSWDDTTWALSYDMYQSPHGKGYIASIHPPTGTNGFEHRYTHKVVGPRMGTSSTPLDQLGVSGGFGVSTKQNTYGIDIQVGLTDAAYWGRVKDGDNIIFGRCDGDSSTVGDVGGLCLTMKDQSNLGIRLSTQGGSDTGNGPSIEYYGMVPSSSLGIGGVTDFAEEAHQFHGRQTIAQSTANSATPLTTDKDDNVIVSGTAFPYTNSSTLNGTGSSAGFMMWQRIGRIVTITGQINFGSGTGQRQVRLPVIGSGGIGSLRGIGTGWTGSNNVALEMHATTGNTFAAKYNNSWFGNAGGDNYRFHLSYQLN